MNKNRINEIKISLFLIERHKKIMDLVSKEAALRAELKALENKQNKEKE